MDDALRAGVAVYNAGEYHAAHDAWEDHWLDLVDGSDDERFLHGLIQFTAAVYHARNRNWSGATKLARSAREYLADLPATYRGVDVDGVRRYLARLEADPERVERARPPALTVDGAAVRFDDLNVSALGVAAEVLAEEYGYDESVVEKAVEYAQEEVAEDTGTARYVALVRDFVVDDEHRALVFRRLEEHVARRERRSDDVAGLFDGDDDSDDDSDGE